MRSVACAFLGLILVGAGITSASAQAWLRVGGPDGRFRIDMPVPFDHPEPETRADGAVIVVYAHTAPDLALRFEVVDLAPPTMADLLGNAERDPTLALSGAVLVSRSDRQLGPVQEFAIVLHLEEGARVHQERLYWIGNRLYRAIAVSTPAREDDPLILRFLDSVRLLP